MHGTTVRRCRQPFLIARSIPGNLRSNINSKLYADDGNLDSRVFQYYVNHLYTEGFERIRMKMNLTKTKAVTMDR